MKKLFLSFLLVIAGICVHAEPPTLIYRGNSTYQGDCVATYKDGRLYRNPACPLCGQNTVVEVVYGQPNREMAERAAAGTIILGGCRVREEKIGCSFCHRYIRPYLERIWQHLLKYPGRDFNPEAIYSEQGDLKVLKGWRCGDDLRAFVIRGRICKFGEQKVFRLRSIPLLTPTENDFRLYVTHKDEDSEIFEYLRRNLYINNSSVGNYLRNKLYVVRPDWNFIMEVLRSLADVPEDPFSGVISCKNAAFREVEEYLQSKKRDFPVKRGEQYQQVRRRFREVCDLETTAVPPCRVLMIRNEKLQFDAPDFQDPEERKTLIRDIRRFLETEFNGNCSRILIQLLADECRSKQDLPTIEKELERFLAEEHVWAPIDEEFACSILLEASIHDPETAIRWTDMIARMLLDEGRIAAELKHLPETSHAGYRKQFRQDVANLYSRTYLSCWRTGNYDAAERWMSFCGDLNMRFLCGNAKEHLKRVKASKEYFAFVRNDPASALRRAVADHDAAGMEAILKTTKDDFLRAEAGLLLGELLLEQGKAEEARKILREWKPPLPYEGHVALALWDIVSGMLSRLSRLQTKNAIALDDVSWLENLAFGGYTSPWAGEARRLGMKYLRARDPERYERGKAYLVRAQKSLSYIILDFEDGLLNK